MKTIHISKLVSDTYTNSCGYALYVVLDDCISKDESVIISFKDATPTSSSFLNSSLGELIDKYGFEDFKSKVRLIEMNKSQALLLKKYFLSCGAMA